MEIKNNYFNALIHYLHPKLVVEGSSDQTPPEQNFYSLRIRVLQLKIEITPPGVQLTLFQRLDVEIRALDRVLETPTVPGSCSSLAMDLLLLFKQLFNHRLNFFFLLAGRRHQRSQKPTKQEKKKRKKRKKK